MQLSSKSLAFENIIKLQKREIVLKLISKPKEPKTMGAEAKILIHATPEQVWKLIYNQERIGQIVPGVKKIKVLENGQDYLKSQVSLSTAPLLPVYKYTLLLDGSEKYNRIKFKKIAGSFNQLYGTWEMEQVNKDTVLTYTMFIDYGFYMPAVLNKYGLNHTLPDTLRAIRTELEKNPNK